MTVKLKKTKHKMYLWLVVSGIICVMIFLAKQMIMNHATEKSILDITTLYTSEMDAQVQARFETTMNINYDEVERIFGNIGSNDLYNETVEKALGHEAYVCDFSYLGYVTEDNEYIKIYGHELVGDIEELVGDKVETGRAVGQAINSEGDELFLFAVPQGPSKAPQT